eukprot:2537596-Amphidinium_carterae.1
MSQFVQGLLPEQPRLTQQRVHAHQAAMEEPLRIIGQEAMGAELPRSVEAHRHQDPTTCPHPTAMLKKIESKQPTTMVDLQLVRGSLASTN